MIHSAARRLRQIALPLGAGFLAALGQAPWSLWYVALIGLALACHLFKQASSIRQAAKIGWLVGLAYFALSLFWIVEPFLVDIARHGWMAPFALAFLAGGLALLWGLAFGLSKWVGMITLVPVWTAFEALRAHLFTGFPWASIGHIWIDSPVLSFASVGGAGLLTLLALTIAALPSLARSRRVGVAMAFGLVVICLGIGRFAVSDTPADLTDKTVRVIQPNAAQHLKWDPAYVNGFFQRLVDMTAQQTDKTPDLIVWPETSVAWRLDRAATAFEYMAQAAGQTPLVFGGNDMRRGTLRNTLAVLHDGELREKYDKHHLVPFGEYIPLGDLWARIGIHGLAARDGAGFGAGYGPRVIDIPGVGRAVPLICYELIFPRNLKDLPRSDMILQITNDAWFGNLSGPYQHLAQARLRAVEQGLPVIRAANTGISAVIDPYGRIVGQIALNQEGFIDTGLPAPLWSTPYVIFGDGPIRLLVLIWIVAGYIFHNGLTLRPLRGRAL